MDWHSSTFFVRRKFRARNWGLAVVDISGLDRGLSALLTSMEDSNTERVLLICHPEQVASLPDSWSGGKPCSLLLIPFIDDLLLCEVLAALGHASAEDDVPRSEDDDLASDMREIWEEFSGLTSQRFAHVQLVARQLLEAELDAGELEEAIRYAHNMKGTLEPLGFPQASLLIGEAEQLLVRAADDGVRVAPVLTALLDTVARELARGPRL